MRVRDSELLLPTTIVGAYPRPLFMRGTKVFTWGSDAPEFPSYWMREQFHDAIALATKDQLDAGLDIVSDGQQHYETETAYEYSELHHYVASRLQGYLAYGEPIDGRRRPHAGLHAHRRRAGPLGPADRQAHRRGGTRGHARAVQT